MRRPVTLTGQLGFTERIFARGEARQVATAVDDGLALVEEALHREVRFADNLADVTTRYLLEAGGKRVRPMLTLLTAQLGKGNTPEVLQAAQAVEITHLASLYHDDVMDDSQMRRGVPTAQFVWGNSVAVLTGDLLFARASKLVSSLGERAIQLQADTFERLCLGQLHETIGPQDGEDAVAHYIRVLEDKTGSLIAVAAQMGIVFSGADSSYEEPVVTFGEKIGVAFQLIDDVIDLSSEGVAETGKTPGNDLRAGVATLPVLRLRERALRDPEAAALLDRLDRDVMGSTADDGEVTPEATAAISALREHEVTRQTLEEAHRWAREAFEALEPLPEGPVKKALVRFADTIVERSS
ncbi:geranylgeranyl pyrophosphate synthase [Leifsonia xyli subsp. xyli]|uniref:Trans-hexaprenyltranstransferase n=2 Tax=Leifsonia xyli subsp. xyli TaxID=59736 RepID=Q6AH97_LEIXX|nr:polyprenyl synthetase family protein [Leifsonia xyli]AAT88248.1 trans-hexaprenyltranstransferase [Leifsonia xyli subsp. xyli str. CTCB07]ODA90346.1 geranylgeranyl pyrophosphate synthase [Leifsonia xyli subsp. xyli]